MIVDGAEVLYTMRNGKIVDPNIPMDGLACYLDTRGKHNTDIYRNTLLDLSGSGNHGTLQNFNFTEESGYVEDLSGGGTSGLKFDEVDDKLSIDVYMSQDFTIFTELNIPATMKGDMRFTIDYQEGSFYAPGIQIIENYILYRIAVRKEGDTITMFANETKGELTDIKAYNRALTDEEIAQLMEVE